MEQTNQPGRWDYQRREFHYVRHIDRLTKGRLHGGFEPVIDDSDSIIYISRGIEFETDRRKAVFSS